MSVSLFAAITKVDYGTVMRVMGRLSAAGFKKVALVTEQEQG
jgi:biopolymer transport protein TolR